MATAVDGTVEVVDDGVNGFLVRPGDIETMARRICTLVLDTELRRRFAGAARVGLGDFDIDRMVRRQEELYQCLLGHSHSSSATCLPSVR